jgi:hypothetical protein
MSLNLLRSPFNFEQSAWVKLSSIYNSFSDNRIFVTQGNFFSLHTVTHFDIEGQLGGHCYFIYFNFKYFNFK